MQRRFEDLPRGAGDAVRTRVAVAVASVPALLMQARSAYSGIFQAAPTVLPNRSTGNFNNLPSSGKRGLRLL